MDTGHRFQTVLIQHFSTAVLLVGLSVSAAAGTTSMRDSILAVGERQMDNRRIGEALHTFSRLADVLSRVMRTY